MMYTIGTRVVHPCHGAGIIVDVEKKRIGETSHRYYVIDIAGSPHETLVMVAMKRVANVGLRVVGRLSVLRGILEECCEEPAEDEIERDYRKRRAIVKKQLKSGSFHTVANMVRNLTFMDSQRRLGFTDRVALDNGKHMLATELALAAEEDITEALGEIEDRLNQMPCSATE